MLVNTIDQLPSSTKARSPFASLRSWSKTQRLLDSKHVPSWWTAYNKIKIKHTNDGIEQCGTLENAVASLAAVFLVLHKRYGYGLVFGMQPDPSNRTAYVQMVGGHLFIPLM